MTANYLQAVFGLIFCIGLILVAASFAKKHREKLEKIFSGGLFTKVGVKRLKAIERLPLAPGHTAILLQKDGVEHFIILSPQSAQVVEAGKRAPKAADA